MEELKITIAAKSYTLNIDKTKREHYLLAERRVNSTISKIQKMNFEGYNLQDAVALAAFDFAMANIGLKRQSDVEPDELKALRDLNKKIEEYLNDPANE